MGMRQPARLSPTPAYGVPEDAVDERSRISSGLLPLLALVIALAAAAMWYVALPALERQPAVQRSCEVVVLRSGATACVRDPARGSQAHALARGRAKR